MTDPEALTILKALKKQIRQRIVYEALEMGINTLAWKCAEKKAKVNNEQKKIVK